MRRLYAVLAASLAGLLLVGLAIAGINRNHSVHLSGGLELPANGSKGQGQAIFHLSKNGSELSYKLITANIENVTQAHIHFGGPTVNGPVVVWLYPSGPPAMLIPGRSDGVLAEGTITEANFVSVLAGEPMSTLVEWLNTGQAYVNVHTSQFPPGEIRGNF